MSKINRITKQNINQKEHGQVLVLVAAALVGIIAVIGLVMDVGMMFVGNARLRRATDAAALAAALQYREGVQTDELTRAATEFLQLNGVVLDAAHPVSVDTCVTTPSLCYDAASGSNIPRKLVRVHVSATIQLAFLPVIGINSVPITAEATSETASLDLVLAIDTSESMTFDALKPGDPHYDPMIPWELRDPSICNDDQKSIDAINADASISADDKAAIIADIQTDGMPGECHPFEEVKKAAVNFVDRMYYPYDRVSVVNFDKTAYNVLQFDQNCNDPGGCTIDTTKATIDEAIKSLTVYEAEGICDDGQPCRPYCTQAIIDSGFCDSNNVDNFLQPEDDGAVYKGVFDCGNGWHFVPSDPIDPSQCTTTDIGDGLATAGNEFSIGQRQGSLWVVVLLTDGSANGGPFDEATSQAVACPNSTWNPQNGPLCRDSSSNTRHCGPFDMARCILNGNGLPIPDNPGGFIAGVQDLNHYDADDYARDMADYVGIDQNALIFTIGLGKQVGLPVGDPAGERLLQYAAEKAGNGLYFSAANTAQLADIFKKIGDNIAIRLTR